ncbi:MAG: glycosyltransferase [Burkholderiaceae bacterium]
MSRIVRTRDGVPPVDLSVIVPVSERYDEPTSVYRAYRRALRMSGHRVEFIYVLDTPSPALATTLRSLAARGEPIIVIELAQSFGESVCLNVGVERAQGERLLMVPPYLQIEPHALPRLVAALDRVDLAAAVRDRRDDHAFNRLRAWGLAQIAKVAGPAIRDLGCMVVACRRRVLTELTLQDEHHRFLPLLARSAGFTVEHLVLPQAMSDKRFRPHGPRLYLARLLDLLGIAFLLRFVQRPFRFFGSVGGTMAVAGLVLGLFLSFEKLVLNVPLAERPALLLATMLVVLGVQIAAVGLIAEIIIFTRSGRLTTYRVDEIAEHRAAPIVAEVVNLGSSTTAPVATADAVAATEQQS